jgi:hypothetical protein
LKKQYYIVPNIIIYIYLHKIKKVILQFIKKKYIKRKKGKRHERRSEEKEKEEELQG